jgi:hypothetical protein
VHQLRLLLAALLPPLWKPRDLLDWSKAPTRAHSLRNEIDNLVSAIATGGLRRSPALGRRLAMLELDLERLEADQRASLSVPVLRVPPDVRVRYRQMLKDLPTVLRKAPARARAALQDVLSPEIILRPAAAGTYLEAEFGLEITALAAFAGGPSESMVAGAGFEPATFGL